MSRIRTHRLERNGFMRWLMMVGVLAAFALLMLIFTWLECMISVPRGHVAVLVKKYGRDMPTDEEVAPSEEFKGIQQAVLTEGRYFKNPMYWDWEIVPQQEVPAGKVGVKVRFHGKDLPYGEFIARQDDQKGIVAGTLNAGRYQLNPYVEMIELHDPKVIPAGFKGVVTDLAGSMPEDPNVLLVSEGFRGVQEKTLDPGTYYINPYEQRVDLVDCRSQRFNLAENRDMGFPSKDGFWVSLDGVVEFRVKPDKAAEVFVVYNESPDGANIDSDVIRKVILPNARSFCRLEGSNSVGREFISGEARTLFQDNFQKVMRAACEPLGIEIVQALITKVAPPEQIAEPVRQREIAKQQEKQYQQEILQQDSESKLAIEKETVKQKSALVQADQEVVVITTAAMQQQEVDITKAQERAVVAQLKLDAAQDEAAAIMSRGQAAAKVQELDNQAEAAGWARAVAAFDGDGSAYAQFVLYEKLAGAYRDIMVNTADSPIMKVFDGFTAPRPATPLVRPTGAPRTAGEPTALEGATARPASSP